MKKFMVGLVIFLVGVGVGVYFAAGMLVEKAAGRALEYFVSSAPNYGFELSDAGFQSAGLASPNSVALKNFAGRIKVLKKNVSTSGQELLLVSDELILKIDNLGERFFFLEAKGFQITTEKDRLAADEFRVRFRLAFQDKGEALSDIKNLMKGLGDFIMEGRGALDIYFSGQSLFPLKGKERSARLSVEKKGGWSVLLMDKDDLRIISEDMEEKLADAEIDVVSQYPLKAPRLLRIRDNAQITARDAHHADELVPEDAYRHVLWSFLLTNAYGEEPRRILRWTRIIMPSAGIMPGQGTGNQKSSLA